MGGAATPAGCGTGQAAPFTGPRTLGLEVAFVNGKTQSLLISLMQQGHPRALRDKPGRYRGTPVSGPTPSPCVPSVPPCNAVASFILPKILQRGSPRQNSRAPSVCPARAQDTQTTNRNLTATHRFPRNCSEPPPEGPAGWLVNPRDLQATHVLLVGWPGAWSPPSPPRCQVSL